MKNEQNKINEIVNRLKERALKAIYVPIWLELYDYLLNNKGEEYRKLGVVEKVARVMESSELLVSLIDNKGYFVYVNKGWINALGYTFGEMVDKNIFDFVHEDDQERTLTGFQDIALYSDDYEKYSSFTNRYRCKDGTYKKIEWRIYKSYHANREINSYIAEVVE